MKRTLIKTFLAVAAFGAAFECAKQIAFPHITIWQSHSITIAVFGITATVAAYVALNQRRRVADSLRASEARYRLLFERNLAGVFSTSLDGRVLNCNQAAARIFGYGSPREANTTAVTDLYATAADRITFLGRLQAEKQLTSFEMRARRKDGSLVWLIMNVHLTDSVEGNPGVIEGTVVDITRLKQAEEEMRRAQEAAEAASRALERSLERLQLALDGANVALWDWNVIENRTYYSEGWARMLGLSPEEVGDSVEIWERLIHPEDKLIATQKLAAHVAGLSDRYQAEFRLRTKEGGWRWIQARGKVVARAADGSPTRVAGTHLDITEHKQLQNTLAEARDAALAGSRAKSAFLANMSHEIRTPLNAILGYSQLMMRDPSLGRAATDKLNIINRSGEHLLALINGILDLSKIEAGRMELNAVQFDAADLLEGLAAMFRLRAEAKGLQLGINVDGEWAKHVVADQGKVRQVLINLLGNAVKFTKRGSIQARVSVGRRKDNQLWLSAEVEDTGTGIAPEEQTELFRPFVQTQSGVELRSGTGLGLAISKEFVRMMGGKITVKSEAGKGSTFRFEIPVQAGSEDSIPLQPVDRRVIGLVPAGPAPRVLIVDDQQHNRGWLSALLTSIGLAVCEADSGPAALRLWQEWKPQLILMDIRMPGMDGLETTRAIRASSNGEQPVVIALTASARHADRQAILQSGIDDVLSKPCGEADLLEKIRAHLKIEYVYADQDTSGLEAPHAAQPPALGPEFLTELPGELIDKLKGAVLMGDKERLNELVRRVADKDTRAARVLQRLADSYEYDALTRLFEQVVAHQVVT